MVMGDRFWVGDSVQTFDQKKTLSKWVTCFSPPDRFGLYFQVPRRTRPHHSVLKAEEPTGYAYLLQGGSDGCSISEK
ncbi:hypothetical protein K1719_024073 [Acacia pycnantha]|nr:hypothetical protein K1719_042567 [Acacia pycnantha]KAI9100949.1 hypothetical protein K1719_024073 [Acacia pycnantha]